MTTPGSAEPLDPRDREEREEGGIFGWARAVVFGFRDTAEEMLEEGRRGAREAYEEGWRRYDRKTRYRRQSSRRPSRR